MKKKLRTLISCLLMLSMVLGVFPLPDLKMEVYAIDGVCGNHATWTLDDDGLLTISGTGEIKPSWTDSYYTGKIKKVVINDGITEIEDNAFEGINSIVSVKMPEGVTSIGKSAFYGCSSLENINIPAGISTIENYTFYGCSKLTDVVIPENVEKIGQYVFYACGLNSITIPVSVTDIGQRSLTSADNVYYKGTSEQWKAITDGHNNTQNVDVNKNNLHFLDENGNWGTDGDWFLYDDGFLSISGNEIINLHTWTPEKVKKVRMGSCVKGIGNAVFSGCVNLTDIIIPDSVTSIGNEAFKNCSSLTGIILPETVETIETEAFYACSSLESIIIPESVTDLPAGVFNNCSSLEKIYYKGSREKWNSLNLHETVGPDLYCMADNGTWTDPDREYDGRWILYEDGLLNISGTGYISDRILDHEWNAEAVKAVEVENGVTGLGVSFANHTNLTSVSLADSVKSLAANAFENCIGLTSFTIPATITGIGQTPFKGCVNLKAIDVSPTNGKYTSIDGILYNKDKTKLISCPAGLSGNCVMPDSVTDIEDSAFKGCDKVTDIMIAKKVYRIASNAFNGCSNLKEIIVDEENPYYSSEDGVIFNKDKTTIRVCSGGISETYTVPESVTIIDEYAFSSCKGLKNINLSTGLRIIRKGAFNNCANLESITFPECVKEIGEEAFENCTNLKEVTLPKELTVVSYRSFGHAGLESITIQNWVNELDWVALPTCLKDIYYCGDRDSWEYIDFYNGTTPTDEKYLTNATVHFDAKHYIPVKAVSILDDITSITLKPGETKWLYYQLEPTYASNKKVIWTSNNTAVATISEYGNVKAIAAGEAVVTAETEDGGKKVSCTVTVTGEGGTDPSTDPDPSKPGKDDPTSDIDNPTPVTEEPITLSENKTEKINDVDVTVSTEITYPKAVNWTGSKITKSQLAALSKEGVIARVKISGLEQAIAGMNKDADLSKLVTISYIIGKEKKAGAEGSFTVKLKLNSKVLKKAKIKGKDKKALENIIKELNKQFKANPYKFKILPVDISDTVNVESVTLKAKLKNGELQLNEDGSIKGLKSLKIKVKVPGLKKAKSYTFSGKKIAKSFTIKLTDAAAKKAEVTALAGQNFTGSRSGVEITK